MSTLHVHSDLRATARGATRGCRGAGAHCGAAHSHRASLPSATQLLGAGSVTALQLVQPLASLADEVAEPATQQLTDFGTTAPDPLIGVLFTLTIAALTLVTGGVATLSFLSWRDSQEEKQSLEDLKAEELKRAKEGDAKGIKTNKKQPIRRATPKGFGRP